MAKAQLERSDLASPGAKFSQAAASLKRFKNSKQYRDELRAAARTQVPATASLMEKRKAKLLKMEAELELAELRTGAAPNVFTGVVKFAMPESE
jgi:hypothetical protein